MEDDNRWIQRFDQYKKALDNLKNTIRLAFKRGLIDNGDVLMQSIKARQLSVHSYNEETALQIHKDIVNIYYPEFIKLHDKCKTILKENE